MLSNHLQVGKFISYGLIFLKMTLQDLLAFAADPINRSGVVFSMVTMFSLARTLSNESDRKRISQNIDQNGQLPQYGEPLHVEMTVQAEYNKASLVLSFLVPPFAGMKLAKMYETPINASYGHELVADVALSFAGFCTGTALAGWILKNSGFYSLTK